MVSLVVNYSGFFVVSKERENKSFQKNTALVLYWSSAVFIRY